jgi:hypothetical protein
MFLNEGRRKIGDWRWVLEPQLTTGDMSEVRILKSLLKDKFRRKGGFYL